MLINAHFSSEQQLLDTLDFIYSKSKEGGTFHGIMEAAFHEITIVTAIHNIKANKGSLTAGLDKKNINHYLKLPYETVISLVQKAVKRYKPSPVRRVYIEKGNGKLRPLGIPTMLDRIIQQCLKIILEPIVEAKFYPHSYGFRPERACKHAISGIIQSINNGGKSPPVIAIEGDIASFFDNVDHRILLKKLYHIGIHDKRVLAIIGEMLKAGYFSNDEFFKTEYGTPQGSILSPLLANVYLNDFDWWIGRMYHEPHYSCKTVKGARRTLRYRGVIPKYIFRYADDWIILTPSITEAKRLLKKIHLYFKHRLKIELSMEKTKITDLTKEPATFLGFNIVAEFPLEWVGKTSTKRLVGKNYPNPEKVRKQVRNMCDRLATLKSCRDEAQRAAVVEQVNSMIVGAMEYWKTGICSQTAKYIDHKIFRSAMLIFQKIYPVTFKEHIIPINRVVNRPERHSCYKYITFAVKTSDMWIGLTKAAITASQWEKYPFNQSYTIYSKEGRELLQKRKQKSPPNPRPPLYGGEQSLAYSTLKGKLANFEYYMNREYAYNRDKGKCRVCKGFLKRYDRVCVRKDNSLPIDKINKVSNLVWVHIQCQKLLCSKKTNS